MPPFPNIPMMLAVLSTLICAAAASAPTEYSALVEPLDHYETAEPALRERAEREGDAASYAALADLHHQRGDWKEGLEAIEAAIALAPDDRDLRASRVELLLLRMSDAGFFGMASAGKALRKACEDDLARDPDNGDAMLCLARYFEQAPGIAGGSSRKAAEMAERLRALGGAPWHLYEAWRVREDAEARIAALRQAALILPRADILVALASALADRGDPDEAIACAARALELFPDDRMTLYRFGRLAAETGRAAEAGEAALLRFLAGPTFFGGRDFRAAGHWRLGMIFAATGRQQQALAAFRRAVTLEPKDDRFRASLEAAEKAPA